MTEDLKISVIVPVHNSEQTLEKCIDSVLAQSYSNFEIVLVENNSTDSSEKLCELISEKDPRIIFLKTQEKGVSNARNLGLKQCSGDIISFLDSDDFLNPDSFVQVIKEFKKCEADVVVTGYSKVKGNSKTDFLVSNRQVMPENKMLEAILNTPAIMGYIFNRYFLRATLENVLYRSDIAFMEDAIFNVEAAIKNKPCMVAIPFVTYNYVNNDKGATNNYSKQYNDKGESFFILSIKEIERLVPKTDENARIVGYCLFRMAVISYQKGLAENIKAKLKGEAKANFKHFRKSFFKYSIKANMKMLAKYIMM